MPWPHLVPDLQLTHALQQRLTPQAPAPAPQQVATPPAPAQHPADQKCNEKISKNSTNAAGLAEIADGFQDVADRIDGGARQIKEGQQQMIQGIGDLKNMASELSHIVNTQKSVDKFMSM